MNHELLVDDHATLAEKGERRVAWDLGGTPPVTICAALGLLKEDLVKRLVVRTGQGNWVVQIGRAGAERDIRLRWYAARRLEVLLGDVELSRWFVFFLKYFRDGLGEVDHLDVEGTSETGEAFDLVLKISLASPSVTAEEARRRLTRP